MEVKVIDVMGTDLTVVNAELEYLLKKNISNLIMKKMRN